MEVMKVNIDPWSSTQSTDYTSIIEQFGLSNMNNLSLPDPISPTQEGDNFRSP